MPEERLSGQLAEKMRWGATGFGLKVLATVLERIGKKDPMLGRALREFDGVYRFENRDGSFQRYLIFRGGGKVVARKNWLGDADFTFSLRDPHAFGLRSKPKNVLEVVLSNKVGQSGNMHYVYQFGFIMSLLERYFKTRKKKKSSNNQALAKA